MKWFDKKIIGGRWHIIPTEEMIEDLKVNFKEFSFNTLSKRYGISVTTFKRIIKEYGIYYNSGETMKERKTRLSKISFMKTEYYIKLKREGPSEKTMMAQNALMRSERNPIKAIYKDKERRDELIRKVQGKIKSLIEREKRRARCGLTKISRIPDARCGFARPYTAKEMSIRYCARKRGYITGGNEERYAIFFDDGTTRSQVFERHLKENGFRVLPTTDMKRRMEEEEQENIYRRRKWSAKGFVD